MEENQAVVFWGIDLKDLEKPDPMVYQANNESEMVWQSVLFRLDYQNVALANRLGPWSMIVK